MKPELHTQQRLFGETPTDHDLLFSRKEHPVCAVLNRVPTVLKPPQKLESSEQKFIASLLDSKHKNQLLAEILFQRGIKDSAGVVDVLESSLNSLPASSLLRECDSASKLLIRAMENGKPVGINGDFDVDGMSSAAMFVRFFRAMGVPYEIIAHDRHADGFGLHRSTIDRAVDIDCALLIAVDHGAANHEALSYAQGKIPTLVIDHHTIPSEGRPPADVFVDPAHPDCGFANGVLCAAGVTYFVISDCLERIDQLGYTRGVTETFSAEELLDLVALATVADVAPLKGANRVLVKAGLKRMSESVGIQALGLISREAGSFSSEDLGFGLGPRLNALGRLLRPGNDNMFPQLLSVKDLCCMPSELGVELLTTRDANRARFLVEVADTVNSRRQDIEHEIVSSCYRTLAFQAELPPAVVIHGEGFHPGVVGCAASRLAENLKRPVALLGTDDQHRARGSLRGVPGFNVVEALGHARNELVKWGGHRAAGGCTIEREKVDIFRKTFEAEARQQLSNRQGIIEAELEMTLADLRTRNQELKDVLEMLGPFGNGNPAPQILVRDLEVFRARGIRGRHIAVTFYQGGEKLTAFLWHLPEHPLLAVSSPGDPKNSVVAKRGEQVDLIIEPALRKGVLKNSQSSIKFSIKGIQDSTRRSRL